MTRAKSGATGTRASTSIELARSRIASLFTYLQELHRVRTPPSVHLAGYEWSLPLASLPDAPTIVRGGLLLAEDSPVRAGEAGGDRPGDTDFLLRVERPDESACPPPPEVVCPWLRPGWDQPFGITGLDQAHTHLVDSEATHVEGLFDSPKRARAFEEWLQRRGEWERAHAAAGIFSQLFDLWARFEREAEKYQLYVGDGILVHKHPEGAICHPVVLQRVELRFNPRIPAFTLVEAGDPPQLYSPLLRHLLVDGKSLLQLQQLFTSEHHPLGGVPTSRFLRMLVQGLWPHGAFFDSKEEAQGAANPYIYRHPVLYLGHRSHDFADAVDRYLEELKSAHELPPALLRVVGILDDVGAGAPGAGATGDATPAAGDAGAAPVEGAAPAAEPPVAAGAPGAAQPPGAEIDLLLTRHANPEQERVIRQLEQTGAVLVQGPPGTGKSHTIANLIGHLLAQKKTILVTSQASKALRVVREKVAGPLQSLCVSILDSDESSATQLEESITGILNYFSTTNPARLRKEIEVLRRQRTELCERSRELKGRLQQAIAEEYGQILVDGEKLSPAHVARRLLAQGGRDGWIPGPVADDAVLPLSGEEVSELYRLGAELLAEDEEMLDHTVPEVDELPTPEQFADACDELDRLAGAAGDDDEALWAHDDQSESDLDQLAELCREAIRGTDDLPPWLLACLSAGYQGKEAREQWRTLVLLIRDAGKQIPPRKELVLKYGPQLHWDAPLAEQLQAAREVVAHLAAGKKLGRMALMFKGAWHEFLRAAVVDEGPATTLEQFRAVQDLLEIRSLRESLARRWDRQMVPLGAPPFATLGDEPEVAAQVHADRILLALGWAEERYHPCERALQAAGLRWQQALARVDVPPGPHRDVLRLTGLLRDVLPGLLAARRRKLALARRLVQRERWLVRVGELLTHEGAQAGLADALCRAIEDGARDAYTRAWDRLQRLSQQSPRQKRRQALLARLAPVAPAWAEAIARRAEGHGGGRPPGDPRRAWQYRQLHQRIGRITEVDLDELQRELDETTELLHDITAHYVEKLAWEAQIERTGLEQQQALAGWLALHKKIGKGAGKNVARLKEAAKNTLKQCQEAVPVWIMPLSRILENFDLATTRFDVVILDEASQCDVLGLVALALGKQVAVVGDHEQVSPYAVGHKIDKIQGLIDELLVDVPNRQLYDGKTSVYDLARQSFGGTIRLLEHFRCVPDIIRFSNNLCYGGEIRALREASSARVKPALVVHEVPGGRAVDKINIQEASEIANLIVAMCGMPEYDSCTIGVICMVGTEQALLIDSLLRKRLPASQYQRHRLLCGNASQFQGDERDVIFLSMVDSPRPGKRLVLRTRDDQRKVFNVAASRARDQLWVVHSLDPERDLKEGDLRLQLISYAENPGTHTDRASKRERIPTDLEKELYTALRRLNYDVTLHGKVGEYTLDLIVAGDGGARVAIQCDGGRLLDSEQIEEAIERQQTLERLGWRFVRIRASRFFLDREAEFNKLCERLRELDVRRGTGIGKIAPMRGPADNLKDRVLARAAELSRRELRNRSGLTGTDD